MIELKEIGVTNNIIIGADNVYSLLPSIKEILVNIAKCSCFVGRSLHTLIFSSMTNTKFIEMGCNPKRKYLRKEMDMMECYLDYPMFIRSINRINK